MNLCVDFDGLSLQDLEVFYPLRNGESLLLRSCSHESSSLLVRGQRGLNTFLELTEHVTSH